MSEENVVEGPLKVPTIEELENAKVQNLKILDEATKKGNSASIARLELEIKNLSEEIEKRKTHDAKMAEKKKKMQDAGQVPYRPKGEALPHQVKAVKNAMGMAEIKEAFSVPSGTRPFSASDVLHCSKVFEDCAVSLVYTSYPQHPKIQSVLGDLAKLYTKAAKAIMEIHNEAEKARQDRIKKRNV